MGLSKARFGFMVAAFRFRAIVPSVPGLGRSVFSSAISYSSFARYGLARIIVLKSPTP